MTDEEANRIAAIALGQAPLPDGWRRWTRADPAVELCTRSPPAFVVALGAAFGRALSAGEVVVAQRVLDELEAEQGAAVLERSQPR